MEHTLEFRVDRGYVLITTAGAASIEGFQQMHRDMVKHPLWREDLNLLMDHRQLDSNLFAGRDVQHMALWRQELRQLRDGVRIATVVETDLGFGLMRMWEALTEDVLRADHHIFRNLEDAIAWLESEPASQPDPAP